MSAPVLEIQLVAVLVAVACALSGVFLVLRRMALMSDAISHSILLGIVVAFFATGTLTSPLLLVGAAATGVVTVVLVELLLRTRLVREDAAIGLVFPALFSIGVILIARHARGVHLDLDVVILGELAFAPFDRLELAGMDLGPRSAWLMGAILLLNAGFLTVVFKELKLTTFDAGLAAALGISPAVVHYAFMGLVSITAVGAFDAVGSILVVALMVAPPSAAYLLTNRLSTMIGLSAGIAAVSAVSGYWLAHLLDASIAGSIAAMTGLIFAGTGLFAPDQGWVARARRRARQRVEFAQLMLTIHLLNHEGTPDADEESRLGHLQKHLRWEPRFAAQVVRAAEARELVMRRNDRLVLTQRGRAAAREASVG